MKKLLTGVYLIIHKASETTYVGSTGQSFRRRWNGHRLALNRGRHPNRHLQAAWKKYGWNAFVFVVAERCLPPCTEKEQEWLDAVGNSGVRMYNKCLVAGSCLGVKRSQETRRRISKTRKGRAIPPVVRLKIGQSLRAFYLDPENYGRSAEMAEKRRGQRQSEETKAKKRAAAVGREPPSEETRRKMRESRRLYFEGMTEEERKAYAEVRRDHARNLDPEVAAERFQKIREANTGKKHTLETREKIRQANTGHAVSEETKRKISEAKKGVKLGPRKRADR